MEKEDFVARFKREMMATLAMNVLVARKARGMRQADVAREAGISRVTVAQIEGAATDPHVSTVIDMARALEVNPMFLFMSKEDMQDIAHLVKDDESKSALPKVSAEDVEKMRRFIYSGLQKDRVKAAVSGAKAVSATAAGSAALAAIGSVLLPGIGTAVGAALGASLSLRIKSEMDKRDEEENIRGVS